MPHLGNYFQARTCICTREPSIWLQYIFSQLPYGWCYKRQKWNYSSPNLILLAAPSLQSKKILSQFDRSSSPSLLILIRHHCFCWWVYSIRSCQNCTSLLNTHWQGIDPVSYLDDNDFLIAFPAFSFVNLQTGLPSSYLLKMLSKMYLPSFKSFRGSWLQNKFQLHGLLY